MSGGLWMARPSFMKAFFVMDVRDLSEQVSVMSLEKSQCLMHSYRGLTEQVLLDGDGLVVSCRWRCSSPVQLLWGLLVLKITLTESLNLSCAWLWKFCSKSPCDRHAVALFQNLVSCLTANCLHGQHSNQHRNSKVTDLEHSTYSVPPQVVHK